MVIPPRWLRWTGTAVALIALASVLAPVVLGAIVILRLLSGDLL